MNDEERRRRGTVWALAGGLTVGFLGIPLAFWTSLAGDRVAGGLFLIAAAVAFGLLANACLRQ